MEIDGMGDTSSSGSCYRLLVVDGASKVAFAYPLRIKDAESVARKRMDLLLMLGMPRSIWSASGTEITAEIVQHLFRWLMVPIEFGPVDHARTQGAVGGWTHEVLAELC